MREQRVADERGSIRGEVIDDVAARVARRVEHRGAVAPELDDVPLAHGHVDAGDARGIGARADDRAARSPLELEIAARVIRVVMRVQNVGQPPALGIELYLDRGRVRRVDGSGRARLRVVQQIAVVVGQARKHVDREVAHGRLRARYSAIIVQSPGRALLKARFFVEADSAMPTITLPDGSQRSFPSPVDGGTIARSIGPRLERDAVAVRIDGALKDLTLPIEHDARIEIVTRDVGRRARAAAPRRGARHGRGRQGAVSRNAGDDRPRHRERLLLRLRAQRPRSPPRISSASRSACMRSSRATRKSCARSGIATPPSSSSCSKASATRPRSSAAFPAGEPITLYRQGGFIDLCRGPHLPSTGRLGAGLQAHEARRRLLARQLATTKCCSASTARRGRTRRSSRPISTGSRKPSDATIASSAGRWTCFTSRTRPSAPCFGTRRAGSCSARSSTSCAPSKAPRVIARSTRRSSCRARCGRLRATGTPSARTCSRARRPTSRRSSSSR